MTDDTPSGGHDPNECADPGCPDELCRVLRAGAAAGAAAAGLARALSAETRPG